MAKTIAVVDVSKRSSRPLGPRFASRRIGGHALIAWMVRRVGDSQRIAQVVAVMSSHDRNALREFIPSDIAVMVSDHPGAVQRMAQAAEAFAADAVVRVTVDSPFVDPSLLDGLICAADQNDAYDFISYVHADGSPAALSTSGLYAEWYRAEALQRARLMSSDDDAIDSADLFCSRPEVFHLRLLSVPAKLKSGELRLRMDEQEDWEHAEEIIDALGPDELDWQDISDFVHHSALQWRMDRLNRRVLARG